MKFCFLASRTWFYFIIFCVCFFILLLVLLVFLWFFVAWKMLAEFSFWFLKYSSHFFCFPPLPFWCKCVCVCSIHTHSDTHVFHTTNLHTHIRTIFSVIVRISIVLSSSLSSCYASFARPIVVSALFVCCSCSCCWRRNHEKPCKAVKRLWQMASQYMHELILA